jgi:hypothetical protein
VTERRWSNALILVTAATVTSLFVIDYCSAVFGCGCLSLWSGADVRCNIHQAGARHCPWCAHGRAASAVPWALIVAAQAAISFGPCPMRAGLRLIPAVAAFPVAGAIIAVAHGISVGWK